uniref:C2H2-type domain-containing protein n=1 Tax=Latimeria chalumnae TaxID=7897 RepID=H3BDC0_LATCH
LNCKPCGHLSSPHDLEKYSMESHSQHFTENKCDYKAEDSSSLKAHIQQTPTQQQILSCDLCGFTCHEESLLQAHYLGKTHLRRQNVAARGGYVQMLTKKSLPKKQYVTVKGRATKAKNSVGTKCIKLKPVDSKRDKNTDNKVTVKKANLFEDTEANEFSVEMMPRETVSSEKVAESLSSIGQRKSGAEEKKLEVPVDSVKCLSVGEQSKKNLSAKGLQGLARSRAERTILTTVSASLRQKGGILTLKERNRKRFKLSGVGGRHGIPDMKIKHKYKKQAIRNKKDNAEVHQEPALSSLTDASCTSATAENTELVLTDSCPIDTENSELKVSSPDQKFLRTCPYCSYVFQNRKGLEIHVKRRHTKEMQFYCQACEYSCVTRGDFEKHCQSNRHRMNVVKFDCPFCSFVTSEEPSFKTHMNEEHESFSCIICKLYFLTEEELVNHEKTEQHSSLLAQQNSPQLSNRELPLQTVALNTIETVGDNKQIAYEIEVQLQDDPEKPSMTRVITENIIKHSTLSTPQLRCKNCFYKTRSAAVLMKHIRLHHAQEYHFLCKACDIYTMSRDGMEKHIKRSKHIQNAKKSNLGLSFDECIEQVCVDASEVKKTLRQTSSATLSVEIDQDLVQTETTPNSLENADIAKDVPEGDHSKVIDDHNEGALNLDNAPKKGKSKGNLSRTCSYCGLLASSVTNLTVHIRRKHSHQYSYLCKVCNYCTVTKGDMERHCATKKHKSRVEMAANNNQNTDIIACPDGGILDVDSKKSTLAVSASGECTEEESNAKETDASVGNQANGISNPNEVTIEYVLPLPEEECIQNHKEEGESVVDKPNICVQRRGKATGENKCDYCEFVAHSTTSLELHVKRKHTREFDYYCRACDYYAVTHREMRRHAATEKHKAKSQAYLHLAQGKEDEITEIPKETATDILEADQHENGNDLQAALGITSGGMHGVQKTNICAESSVVERDTNSELSENGCISIMVETEKPVGQENDFSKWDEFQKAPEHENTTITNNSVHLEEQSNFKDQNNKVEQNLNSSTWMEKTKLSGLQGAHVQHSSSKNDNISVVDNENPVTSKTDDAEMFQEGKQTECIPQSATEVRRDYNSAQQTDLGDGVSVHASDQSKDNQDDPIVEQALLDAQHEAEAALKDNTWEVENSALEDMQETVALRTVESTCDGSTESLQNTSLFDASIVKLRESNDNGTTDTCDEDHLAGGTKTSNCSTKSNISQGGKKRKTDGTTFAESTRIRCDDCGFLADGLSGLNVHIAMKHPSKEKHFHCLLCGKSFYTESNLHQHLASAGHLRNEQASVEELPEGGATFKCVKCTEPFDSEQSLFLHIKEKHEELLREVNKYIVEDTEQINREREENQGNVCKYCGKVCKSSNSMAFMAHIRTHTGSKPFKCKICNFATAQLGDARNHVKRHLGMREYKCHVCG